MRESNYVLIDRAYSESVNRKERFVIASIEWRVFAGTNANTRHSIGGQSLRLLDLVHLAPQLHGLWHWEHPTF